MTQRKRVDRLSHFFYLAHVFAHTAQGDGSSFVKGVSVHPAAYCWKCDGLQPL